MKAIRLLLFTPIVLFAMPAILIIAVIVLLAESKEAPLRNILAFNIRRHGFAHGIKRFMQTVFIPSFRYNIQRLSSAGPDSCHYGGSSRAGVLPSNWCTSPSHSNSPC